MPTVRISVVIASYNSVETIGRCLRSLERQDLDPGLYEVIVVDSSEDGTANLIARDFPTVTVLEFEERKYPGDARNVGVARSRGEIVAFTDADCYFGATWLRGVLDAHAREARPVIGGAVDNGNPESYVGWAYYFAEFSSWIPERSSRELVDIPTTCLTMKRWAFDRYGPFLERTYSSDTAFNWKAGRNGYRPLFAPSLRVSHVNVVDLRAFLGRRLARGRSFAVVRVQEQGLSTARRLGYACLCPLLPLLLFGRAVRCILRKRTYRREFLLSSPLVFIGFVAWSAGEMRGYL